MNIEHTWYVKHFFYLRRHLTHMRDVNWTDRQWQQQQNVDHNLFDSYRNLSDSSLTQTVFKSVLQVLVWGLSFFISSQDEMNNKNVRKTLCPRSLHLTAYLTCSRLIKLALRPRFNEPAETPADHFP